MLKGRSCTSLYEYLAQTPRVNTSPFAMHVANRRGRRKETRASLTLMLRATSSKHPMMGWLKSSSSSPVIRNIRARMKAHIRESASAIQDLNSFRTGSKSYWRRTSIKDNRDLLRLIVFHGLSRLGSGNAVKAPLLPMRLALYPTLVASADNII